MNLHNGLALRLCFNLPVVYLKDIKKKLMSSQNHEYCTDVRTTGDKAFSYTDCQQTKCY